jgi:hypothetical protein
MLLSYSHLLGNQNKIWTFLAKFDIGYFTILFGDIILLA